MKDPKKEHNGCIRRGIQRFKKRHEASITVKRGPNGPTAIYVTHQISPEDIAFGAGILFGIFFLLSALRKSARKRR